MNIPKDNSKKQGKYWCWTYNNPACTPAAMFARWKDAGATYVVFGVETAPTTGTLHWQGYTEFEKVKRFGQVRALFEGIHVEYRVGSQQQAIDYCKGLSAGKTPNEVVHEDGTPTANVAGKRNDLSAAVDVFKEGGMSALAEELPDMVIKYHRGFDALAKYLKPPVKPVPHITLCFGPPRIGKTRVFYDETSPDNQWATPVTNGLWFDGYIGQEDVLFDDFDGKRSHTSLRDLLRILDRYPIQVGVKGSHVWWVPKRIYITTNFFPRDWYDWETREQQWPALVGRVDRVVWFKSKERGTKPVVINRPDPELSIDVVEDGLWEHFWNGPNGRQLELDRASGRLVSNAPADVYNW